MWQQKFKYIYDAFNIFEIPRIIESSMKCYAYEEKKYQYDLWQIDDFHFAESALSPIMKKCSQTACYISMYHV